MTTEKFKIGDLVWAKMKGYPHWPAKVVKPLTPTKASKNKLSTFVYFFGSKNHAWILDKNIIPHSESTLTNVVKKKSGAYQQAIDEFLDHLKTIPGKKESVESKKKPTYKSKDTDNESVENNSNSKSSKFDADDDSTEPKDTPPKSKAGKKKVYKKKSSSSISPEEKDSTSKPVFEENEESDSTSDSIDPFMHSSKMKQKRKILYKKKRISNGSGRKESSSFPLRYDDDDSASSRFSNEPFMSSSKPESLQKIKKGTKGEKVTRKYKRRVGDTETPLKKFYKRKSVDSDFNGKTSTSFSYRFDKPSTYDDSSNSSWGSSKLDTSVGNKNELEIMENTGDLPEENTEQPKSIGFLGLDCMGKFIVNKFLENNFDITLWKEEVADKDKDGYKGAKMADSPAEMISDCDVIFSYYSDTELLKKNFDSEIGILKGFEEVEKLGKGPKGFVLLAAIDKQTSSEIYDAITIQKGLYLEAPICGTIEEAEKGKLIIFASGNMKLFNDCKKYLATITKICKFLRYKDNAEITTCNSSTESANYSSKYSIVVNMLNGGIAAAVAEAALLTKKLAIPQQDMMNVMDAALKCNFGMNEKLDSMNNRTFNNVHTPLKHAQKDLDFCLQIADSVSHPMPIASATNEVLKQAKLLNYSDADVTSVYKILKY